jgi:NAD(P)-dependent dehydrogenase (short-subunit alcohol dehydrogenase family)
LNTGAYDLSGKVVIVTGAARGLGRDYSRYFAQDGAAVVLADVRDVGSAVRDITDTGARALGVEVDVTDLSSVQAMVAQTLATFGRVDVLINNAGIWRGLAEAGLLGIDPEMWNTTFAVNVTGTLLCAQAVVPAMREQGWGRIVNISSMASRMASGAYSVTKMAVNQLTLTLAAEVGHLGITVNCVAPGISAFEAAHGQLPNADEIVDRNIIKRMGTSRDLYGAFRYLCGPDSDWVTGQTLHVNGGAFSVF